MMVIDEFIAKSLMIPLAMIVVNEFRHSSPEVSLAEWNQAIEALLLDRPHEAFGMRIRIGRAQRRAHDVDAGPAQQVSYRFAPFPVAVANQYAMLPQDTVGGGRERATDLPHEYLAGMRSRADDLNTVRREVDHKESGIRH